MKHAFLHPLTEFQALDGKELESFYDHDWAKVFFGDYGQGHLKDACFSLCASLKSASIVHSYPILIAKLAKAGIGGALSQNRNEICQHLNRFADFLSSEISPTPDQRQKNDDALGSVKLALATATQAQLASNESNIWDSICNQRHQTLVVATTGALRLVFNGLFAAFECFCQDCCSLVHKDESRRYRYRGKNNPGTLEETFDANLYDQVLGGQIEFARLVRNSLVHRSGQVPAELKAVNHGFQTSPAEFIIVPADNRRLFTEIKTRSLLLAQETSDAISSNATLRPRQ